MQPDHSDQLHLPTSSYPAGEATPVVINDLTPEPVLPASTYIKDVSAVKNGSYHVRRVTPHAHPRPRSSWYSQPSIAGSNPRLVHVQPAQPLSPPPPIPRLTPATLRSLEQRFATPESQYETDSCEDRYSDATGPWRNSVDTDDDEDQPVSPKAMPTRKVSVDAYLTASKRTAVSEYLRDRAWIAAVAATDFSAQATMTESSGRRKNEPGMKPPPVSASGAGRRESLGQSIARKISVSSSTSERKSDTTGRSWNDVRRMHSSRRNSVLTARSQHRRSSAANSPYHLEDEELEYVTIGFEHTPKEPQVHDSGHTATQDHAARFERLDSPHKQRRRSSQLFRASSISAAVSSLSALRQKVPGHRGKSVSEAKKETSIVKLPKPPVGVPYESMRIGPQPIHITKVSPIETPGRRAGTNSAPYSKAPRAVQTYSSPPSLSTVPPSYRTLPTNSSRTQTKRYTDRISRTHKSRAIQTQTRDPLIHSDQGCWLYIGTMRGPSPSGLRSLHATMEKAIAKHGVGEVGMRKGCKEVRKWLKHEERCVIEWVIEYVRAVWGVEI